MQRNQRSGSIISASGTLQMSPSMGVDSSGGSAAAVGGALEMDKRLLWFEARLSAAFRATSASGTGAASAGSHAIVAAKFAADIRKVFDDDDVRRDITSFCESDVTRMLVAFPHQSAATGGATIKLTASLADPLMHQAAKVLCFRKLVQTLKSPIVAAAAAGTSGGAAAAAAGGPTAGIATGGSQSSLTNNGAAGGAAASPTAAGGGGGAGVANAAAPANNVYKITHDNIHRLVSFIECKPHMLSFMSHFVSDVVMPLSQATVAAPLMPVGTGAATASGTLGRLSVIELESSVAAPPPPAELLPAWGAYVTRPPLPAPVRKCIEVEMESVAQGALVAGGTAEGRTQLPGISPGHLREELAAAAQQVQSPTTAADDGNSGGRPRRSIVVTFGNTSSEGGLLGLSPSVSGIHNANQQISVSDAERLAGRWIHQLRETATNTTPVGEHQKQSMASSSAFRFVPISPYDEVAYWRGRVEDLNYLSAQLQGSTFRSVETVLSAAGSLYVENLQAARLEIQDQTREAQIVLRWLTPLLPFFDAISLQSPTHMELVALLKETIFEKIFHLFFIMWAQCPSSVYPSCARLASVIAGLADYVVVHVTHHLSLDMYFLSDPDETRRRIKLAFDVATRFKNAFFTFKNKASRVVHPAHMAEAKGEWQANTQQLFSHLDGFLERCNDILEVLELRQHLEKLTMLNISSVEAEPLRVTVTDVNKRFHDALISFSQHAVDHVSERNDIFDTWMKEKLLATAKEAMQKLGQEILADATNGPFGVNLFRRMHALMPVLQHPHMRSHAFLQQVLSTLWKRWSAEIRQIQKIHVDNEYQTFLVQHVPNATKSLLFSLAVFRRLYELHVVAITLVHEPYVDQESEDLQEALLVYNATCQRVGAAFERCFQKWSSSLGEVIARLNASLLQRHPLSRRYYCSLDHHVRDALRDVAMIVAVMTQPLIKDVFAHLEVPAEAFVIMQLKQDLWSRFTKLHSIVSTYYEHVRSVQPHERGLVEFELGTAEMLCKRAADQLTWEDDGDAIDTFNDEIAAAVKAVGDALDAIRAPIQRVDAAFESLHEAECAFLPLKVSRVGDRTMSVEDFIVRYYENIAGGKRKQALATLVERQHQVAESLITSLNELKQAYRAPLIEYQSPVVRAYLHFSVTQYWSRLNMFAKESLDNLAHQLDPTWIAQNGGMPLIDAQLVVVEKMIADEPPKRISGGGAGGNGTPSTLAFPAASGGAGASSMNKSLIVSSASTAASTALRQKAMLAASVWTMQRNVAAHNGSGNARPHTASSSATATASSIPVLAFSPDIQKNLRPIIGRMIDEVLGALKSGITALLQYKGRELPSHTNNPPSSAGVTGPALGFACHSLFHPEKDETLPITDASGKPPPASPHVRLATNESEPGPFEKTLNNDPRDHSDTDSSHNVSATTHGGEGAEIDGHVVVAIPQLAPHQTTPSHRQSTPPPATTPLLSSHPATPSAARRMSTNKLLAAQHSMKIRRMVATFQGLPFDGATYPPMLIVDPVTDLQDQCTLFVESASRKASQPLDQLGSHTFRPKPLDTNVLLTSTSTIAPSQLVEDTTDDGIFSDFTSTKRRRSSGQTSTAVSLAQFVEQVGRSGTPHDALLVQVMSSISFTVDSGVLSATRRLDALLADAVAQASTLTIPMYAFDLLWSPAAAQQLKTLVRDGVQDALPFAAPPSLNVPSFTSPTAASVRRRSLSIATADFVPTNVYGLSVDDLKRELLDARTLTERIPTEIPLMKLICNGWLQVDLRVFKHNMLVQSEALQTFLLDYVRDQTISTIESLEDYVQESGNRLDSVGMLLLDQNSSTSEVGESTVSSIAATGTSVSALGQSNGGGAAANSRHSALREYFELLRLIHRRFEAEKEVFVTLSQGLRLLSGQEHLPKHEVQWLTQRIESLQPAWEALFQRGLAVRAQLASVQDSETAAMRHGAVLLNEKITNHQQHMRSGPLFTPDSLETDHNGRLQEAILWPVVLSAADEAALVGDGEHDDDDDAAAGDVGSVALDSSLTVVMAAEHAALAALGGMQYIQTDDVYELLNASMAVANAQGEALEEFRMLQDLFEATTAIKLNLVQDAKQELVLVKGVWDLTIHMNHHVAQWMQTTFADVDASSLVEECRRFASAYAAMPVLVRQWPVFKMAEARVAAFTESLPLIHDLKSPALRQRHWLDLSVAALGSAGDHRKEADDDRMSRFSNAVSVFDKGDDDDNLDGMGGGKQPALTGVPSIFIQQQQQAAKKSAAPNNTSFNGGEPHHSTQPATLSVLDPTSPAFTLGTLLRLNLHEHSAFVRKLVERAEKELVIERTIARIALFWENAALHFVSASHNVASALAIQQNRRHFDDPTASFMAPLPTTSTGVIMRAPPALQVKSTAPTPSSVHVLGPLDEVVETLDEHLNLLQNMLHSRWVDVFRRAAQSWQLDLQYVESVLSTWVDLQTSLLNLFPIFARSEDLRSTMDEEANAFDAASELFFILCRELYHATNRVGGTTASSATAEDINTSAVYLLCTTTIDVPQATLDEMSSMLRGGVGSGLQSTQPGSGALTPSSSMGGSAIASPTRELKFDRAWATCFAADGDAPASTPLRILPLLEAVQDVVTVCERRLGGFLELKRRRFPRFFFLSDADLISILSQEHHPPSVCTHITQIMASVERVVFEGSGSNSNSRDGSPTHEEPGKLVREGSTVSMQREYRIIALHSVEGEVLPLPSGGVLCTGRAVEAWLDDLLVSAQVAVREVISRANISYVESARPEWMFAHVSQAVLTVARSHWTSETTAALEQVENGSLSAMGDLASHLRTQLARTIECILMPMTPLERKGLISLITVDVHGRDVVQELLQRKIDSPLAFAWQAQTRVYFFNEVEESRRKREAALAAARANGKSAASRRRASHRSAASSTSPMNTSLLAPHSNTDLAVTTASNLLSPTGAATTDLLSPTQQGLLSPRSPTDFDLAATHAVDRCTIQICDTSFSHGLDYTGNCGCLVTTPLTDRCYITMTQALKLCKGGAPAGPAGTGKTETVKDIAHTLGYPVYVFNCSDQMDVLTVSNIFKGLAMSGAWGCFDEFNRIAAEVLSVLAAQVKVLFDAKRRNADTFQLLTGGHTRADAKARKQSSAAQDDEGPQMPLVLELPLVSSVGVFITMNPGYKGRTELPENVKALFRPCAMVIPDVLHISEILLCAEGYKESKELAAKFVRLYELNHDVLSPEAHYDWGLRAMRAVLLLAGQLKRQQPNRDERSLLLRALRDANTAKLTTPDLHMFERLLVSLFPGVKASNNKDETLENAINETMSEQGFFAGTDKVVLRKVLQLRDLLSVRHSVFIMGGTGTGKSSLIQLAKASFEAAQERCRTATTILSTAPLDEDGVPIGDDGTVAGGVLGTGGGAGALSMNTMLSGESFEANAQGVVTATATTTGRRPPRIHMECFDPKALSAVELYGSVHPYTREWSDGVLSRAFRDFATNHARYHPSRSLGQWIVLDGSIDADWIESMNSVMDDNKLLTLVNNERISMTTSMRLMFEITNLDHATPATVSRAGILYLNRGDIGWIAMKDRWLLFQPERVRNILDPIFDKAFEKFLQFVVINSGTNLPMNPVAHLRNVCHLLQGVLDREEFHDMGTITAPHNYERVFLWVCIWAFGLSLPPISGSTDFRTIFSTFVRREFHAVLKIPESMGSVFDVDIAMNVATREVEWIPWRKLWQVPDYFNSNRSPKRSPVSNGGAKTDEEENQPQDGDDEDLTFILEDRAKVTEDMSLLISGSRSKLNAKAIESLNPFARYSAYTPLRFRFVPLPESTAQVKLLAILVQSEKHVAVVGEAGTGKSSLLRYFTQQVLPLLTVTAPSSSPATDAADSIPGSPMGSPRHHRNSAAATTFSNLTSPTSHTTHFSTERIGMHSLSDSAWLQSRIDKMLEKHAGRQFAPSSGKQLMLVIENLNLPAPDSFGSQSAHALLRQFLEYGYWYDRSRLTQRHIKQVQLVATVNPSCGQQDITERLAHKLFLFSTHQPSAVNMQRILSTLVAQALVLGKSVSAQLLHAVRPGVEGATGLMEQITKSFHPAVESFHYHFTMRDLLRLGQGLITVSRSTPEAHIPSLWVYEALSVFGDRLISTVERDHCSRIILALGRNAFNSCTGLEALQDVGERAAQLPIFVPFSNVEERPDGSFDPLPAYTKAHSFDILSVELKKRMMRSAAVATSAGGSASLFANFVFFDDAISNVCKLSRILSHPGGHAIVVGVSGSGKRSLVKLAADVTCFRIHVREVSAGNSLLPTNGAVSGGGPGSSGANAQQHHHHHHHLSAQDVRQEFSRLMYSASVKNIRTCIILTHGDLDHWGVRQAVDEFLCTSYINDTFTSDERGEVLSKMAQELRSKGEPRYVDVSFCMEYLKEKLSNNLRIVCCLSPFLKTLKPLLRSCSGFLEAQILYFLEWPQDALIKVAERIVFDASRGGLLVKRTTTVAPNATEDLEATTGGGGARALQRARSRSRSMTGALASQERSIGRSPALVIHTENAAGSPTIGATSPTLIGSGEGSPTAEDGGLLLGNSVAATVTTGKLDTETFATNVCTYLASTHQLARDTANYIRRVDHQDVHVTPKTFLTFCQQALTQIKARRNKLETRHTRLSVGLERLHSCRDRVGVLQIELGEYKKAVQQQATVANQLFARVRAERNVVEDQNRIARAEHERTQKIVDEVNALVAECEADIAAAQPIVDAAKAALNTLNRPNLTELKTMNSPPEPVHAVTGCVMCIISPGTSRVPLDRSWAASRRMMADVPKWMKTLEELDVNHLPDANINAIEATVRQSWFNPIDIVRVSFAASSLCAWVVNVVKYHHIRVMLRPKEARLAEAQQRLASSQAQAKRVQDRCDVLQGKLDALVAQCNEAEAERDRLDALLSLTEAKLQRAQRLLAALADEKERWAEGLTSLSEDREFVDGDSLLGAAFATYCGPFPANSRERLINLCSRELDHIGMPVTPSATADVIRILFESSEAVVWRNEGLAAAVYMAQNAAITLTGSTRWPMVIDPQHQAIQWLRGRAAARSQSFTILSPSDPELALKAVECVSKGHLTVVELNAPYDIPPLLLALVEKRYQQKIQMRRSQSTVGSAVLQQRRRSLSPATSPPEQHLSPDGRGDNVESAQQEDAEEDAPPTLVPLTSSLSMRNIMRAGSSTSGGGTAAAGGAGASSPLIVSTVDIGPDHEAIVHNDFFLVIRCSVSRPTLRPDVFSQCSIIDFRVTESALTEEMLSIVVSAEQPALEKERSELNDNMNRMTVTLRNCESLLLNELATATGDLLENEVLIQTLEHAKQQSVDLTASLIAAQAQRSVLQRVLSIYEPIALRGCLMYMGTNHFYHVDPVYHYSMDLFVAQFRHTVTRTTRELNARQAAFLERAAMMTTHTTGGSTNALLGGTIKSMPPASPSVGGGGSTGLASQRPPPISTTATSGGQAQAGGAHYGGGVASEVSEEERLSTLLANVTTDLYRFVDQSLFAEHKLVYSMTVAITVLQRTGAIEPQHALHFLRGSKRLFGEPPKHVAEWLSKAQWEQINRLADLDGVIPSFRNLVDECVETTRWKSWCELSRPEGDRLPGDWKTLTPFQRLLLVKALRPDRVMAACHIFLQESFLSKALAAAAALVSDDHMANSGAKELTSGGAVSGGLGKQSSASSPSKALHHGAAKSTANNPIVKIVEEMPNKNPILFLLTPGFDPEAQVHQAAAICGMDSSRVIVLSMGQSQERRAKEAMERARTKGVWVLLHNIHLMRGWLPHLESFIQSLAMAKPPPVPSSSAGGNSALATSMSASRLATSASENNGPPSVSSPGGTPAVLHPKFRLFLSTEPVEHLPSGLLQNSVKIVQEPPSGLRHNFLRGYQSFAESTPWEHSTKPHEFHLTVYSLCYFHAVAVERAKFGPVGWNTKYPFNSEDLRVCVDVLTTYIEDRPRIPWEDLRYMFGEIMYGGHITEQWDRRLSMTYLTQFISPDVLERHEIAPGVPLPRTRNHAETKQLIMECFPEESPVLYQLNPVSENRVRLRDGRSLIASLVSTVQTNRQQPAPASPGSPRSADGKAAFDTTANLADEDDERIDDISLLLGALPDLIQLDEVAERLGEDRPPFHHVFYQECERMNRLVLVMQKTLDAAEAAVRGTQAMSSEIDDFLLDVSCDRIPQRWRAMWGHTKRPLAAWLQLVGESSRQLNRWAMELMVPKLVNISCLFIPIAFIGAVLQDASIRIGEALDRMSLVVEVTKRQPSQIELHAREGIYVHGASLEGAAWDPLTQCLQDATLRDGLPMPVLILRAAPTSKVDRADTYACPLYHTTDRGATFVTALHLRTKVPSSTWILRGTALILDAAF